MVTEMQDRQLLEFEADNSRRIQELDPLEVDIFMVHELPGYNKTKNSRAIRRALPGIIPNQERIDNFSINECEAAMRDLGMIAGSLQYHGINISSLPHLENALVALGNRTGGVPRDTVFHYAKWNPADERMRTFTGTDEERIFIHSLQEGMSGLDSCIKSLIQAQTTELGSEFAELLTNAKDQFDGMTNGMVEVIDKITPKVFTGEISPYFPVLNIAGKDYAAPNGAQMAVLLVDRILWGADLNESNPHYQEYLRYYEDNKSYLPKEYRNDLNIGNESIISRIVRESEASGYCNFDSRNTAADFFNSLIRFRRPHFKTANDNFALRDKDAKGSGGYEPSTLRTLLELTYEARDRIK
jgi:monodechloroaminopyrrolnitrin synthase